MAICKHSKRTFRPTAPRYCPLCRTQVFYLGHDTAQRGSWLCNKNWCDGFGQNYKLVYLNIDESLHVCPDGRTPEVESSAESESEETPALPPVNIPNIPAVRPVSAAAVNVSAEAEAMAKLREAMQVFAPQANVNADEVRQMIAVQVPAMVEAAIASRPALRLEIKRANGEVHTVQGLTHFKFPKFLKVLNRQNVFMPGPAGTGKSHMVKQAADALGLPFFFIQVGPTMLEHALMGFVDGKGDFKETPFYLWANCSEGAIFMLDEGDNGNAGVLNVLNSALGNGLITFPNGEVVEVPANSRVVVTANTNGDGPDRTYVGRQELDGAFVNRFVYFYLPNDDELERALCLATGLDQHRVDAALAYVRAIRKRIERFGMPIIMGLRNSRSLCILLEDFDPDEAVEMAVRKGMAETDWNKISADAPSVFSMN